MGNAELVVVTCCSTAEARLGWRASPEDTPPSDSLLLLLALALAAAGTAAGAGAAGLEARAGLSACEGQWAGGGAGVCSRQQVPAAVGGGAGRRQRASHWRPLQHPCIHPPTWRCRSCCSRHQVSWLYFLKPSSATSMPCPAASRCCTSGASGWQGIGGGGGAKSLASSGGSPPVGATQSSAPSPGRRGRSGDKGDRRGGLQHSGELGQTSLAAGGRRRRQVAGCRITLGAAAAAAQGNYRASCAP